MCCPYLHDYLVFNTPYDPPEESKVQRSAYVGFCVCLHGRLCAFLHTCVLMYITKCAWVWACVWYAFMYDLAFMYVNIQVYMNVYDNAFIYVGTSTEFDQNLCVICRKGFEVEVQKSTVTWGLPNLIEYCRLHRNWALHSYLIQQNSSSPLGILHIHPQCRRSFVDLVNQAREL